MLDFAGKGKARPTVMDVARLARVSSSTVSRVLNGNPVISRETRERVMAAVEALDFQLNATAQALRRGRGNTVAILVSDIEQHVYHTFTKNIQAALEEIGVDLLLYDLGHSGRRLRGFLDRAIAMRLRGIVIATSDVETSPEVLQSLRLIQESGIAIIAVQQPMHEHGIVSIVQDNRDAAAQAVGHLLSQGRRRIAFIGRLKGSVASECLEGYGRALRAAGIEPDPALILDTSKTALFRFPAGHGAISQALAAGVTPDGVITASDEIALGAMAALRDAGLGIPEDVAVIGFGDADWGRHTRPRLTTMSEHAREIARAVQTFFKDTPPSRQPLFRAFKRRLIRRDSA